MSMECNATKTVTIYEYAIIDRNGDVLPDGSGHITAENEADAKIELAREFPDVKAKHIIVQAWKTVVVANPDAIATVRVINTEDDAAE